MTEERRRVIASVMLIHTCSFEDASAALEEAVRYKLQQEQFACWSDSRSLAVWVQQASMYAGRATAPARENVVRGLFGARQPSATGAGQRGDELRSATRAALRQVVNDRPVSNDNDHVAGCRT